MALASQPNHSFLKCITNSRQIHNHPLNTSLTKQQYTFPHQDRMPKKSKKTYLDVGYYDVNYKLIRSNFAVSIGKGKKTNFENPTRGVPGPNRYYPLNLSISQNKKQGFSFGLSREQVPQNGIGEGVKTSANKPGPGTYTPLFSKTGRCVTFKFRVPLIDSNRICVGPGQYPIPPLIETLKRSFDSRVKSVKSPKYPPLKDKKSENIQKRPQSESVRGNDFACYTNYQINPKGVFFNSRFRNTGCGMFGKDTRIKERKTKIEPGPGQYLLPSDFGIYTSSKV